MDIPGAATFAVTITTLLIAHNVADHWVQTGHQALNKSRRDWAGRRACAGHVVSYTILTAGMVGLVWALFVLPISLVGFILGQTASAVTHYWADRRFTLAWLAKLTGKREFYQLGFPREGRDDNPSLGTGAYALDQSWHWAWLFVAALITALV